MGNSGCQHAHACQPIGLRDLGLEAPIFGDVLIDAIGSHNAALRILDHGNTHCNVTHLAVCIQHAVFDSARVFRIGILHARVDCVGNYSHV